MKSEIPEVEPEIPSNAVSVYGAEDVADDFPVLKAFQQYIDAEQNKARKRMMMLCTFFGVIMIAVICFFMYVLHNADAAKASLEERNQALNDKLVDYAIKDRDRERQAPMQDNAAIQALTAKLEALQKQLADAQDAAKAKSPAEVEVEKLRAQLAIEKEKAAIEEAKLEAEREKQKRLAAEKERQRLVAEQEKARIAAENEKKRQEELEAYRRKHYPELYAPKTPSSASESVGKDKADQGSPSPSRKSVKKLKNQELSDEDLDELLEDISLDEEDAVDYFEDAEDEEEEVRPVRKTKTRSSKKSAPTAKATDSYTIPVDVKGFSGTWEIPE